MKIVFAGTPEFAAQHLAALIDSSHEVVGVYTQPDRPSGRGKKLKPSPVKQLALDHGLAVFQPASLKNSESQAQLAELDFELMIVVAYGLILPTAVLELPAKGCINVHGSILPRWRGAAPIQRAIEAGDSETGVTIMQMDEGLDTGNMLMIRTCDITPTDSSVTLFEKLAAIGPVALIDTIAAMEAGELQATAQDDSASNYAAKIEKSEAEIQWSESVTIIDRKIRAFNPFPICYTELRGERLKIHRGRPIELRPAGQTQIGQLFLSENRLCVLCGEGVLEILMLQLPGKKAMSAEAFINGFSSTYFKQGEDGTEPQAIMLGQA